jgi:hypothetical protein
MQSLWPQQDDEHIATSAKDVPECAKLMGTSVEDSLGVLGKCNSKRFLLGQPCMFKKYSDIHGSRDV